MNRLYEHLRQNRQIMTIALMALLLMLQSIIIYNQYTKVQAVSDKITANYEVLRHARRVLSGALNIETGYRGYLLSHDQSFLLPYEHGQKHVWDDLRELQQGIKGYNLQLNAENTRINEALKEVVAIQTAQVEKFKKTENIRLVELKAARTAMDTLRTSMDNLIEGLTKALEEALEKQARYQKTFWLVTVFGTLGALLVLGGVTYMMNRVEEHSDALEDEIFGLRERQKLAFEAMNDGVFDSNLELDEVYLSPRLKQILGFADDELPNDIEAIRSRIHPDDREGAQSRFDQYVARKTKEFLSVFRVLHKNGSNYVWILARGKGYLNSQGKMVRLVGAYTDITQEKIKEENLLILNRDLENFTYIASHDLRSPLVNIKGFTRELQHTLREIKDLIWQAVDVEQGAASQLRSRLQTLLDRDVQESLRFINVSIEKMDRLTSAILDLSRIGRRVFLHEEVNTQELVERIVQSMHYMIDSKKAKIDIQPLPVVRADPLGLEQVLGNIIENAVKYLDPDKQGTIQISALILPHAVRFAIEDNGRGISMEDSKKVFGLFRRTASSQGTEGHGMGMAYVKATVQRWGGHIWFDSEWGRGTTFYFTVPLVAQSGDAHPSLIEDEKEAYER